MSKTDLAARLGISRQALTKLESREVEGTATLASLSAAAEALGAELVWAIIPRESITRTLDERAYQVAAEMVSSVKHTMRLEDQETKADGESRIRELAEELKSTPNRLWSLPHDE